MAIDKSKIKPILEGQSGQEVANNIKSNFSVVCDASIDNTSLVYGAINSFSDFEDSITFSQTSGKPFDITKSLPSAFLKNSSIDISIKNYVGALYMYFLDENSEEVFRHVANSQYPNTMNIKHVLEKSICKIRFAAFSSNHVQNTGTTTCTIKSKSNSLAEKNKILNSIGSLKGDLQKTNQGMDRIGDEVFKYLPSPLNTNAIVFTSPTVNSKDILFKDTKFTCTSSGKQWQYALFKFPPRVGGIVYAKCTRVGGEGNILRLKGIDADKNIIFEQSTSQGGRYISEIIPQDCVEMEVTFMICAANAIPSGETVYFKDVEVGYTNSELDNIYSVNGICYNRGEIVWDSIKKTIYFPETRWHFGSYIGDALHKEYKGYSVLAKEQTISADPKWGGIVALDRKNKTYSYLNLSADDATVNLDKLIIVGSIQGGRGANFKAPFRIVEANTNDMYKSIKKISLSAENSYPFTQTPIITKRKRDNDTDMVDWDGNQSIAIFKDYIFSFQEYWGKKNSMVIVFDKKTMSIIGRGDIPKDDLVYNNHFNSAQFSNEYYQPTDEFPLLYISTFFRGYLFVIRITRVGEQFSFEIIQKINSDIKPSYEYGNSYCCDFKNKKLFMYYNINGDYTVTVDNDTLIEEFNLPSFKQGNVTLKKSESLSTMRTPFFVLQGSTYYGGRMYIGAQGRNDFLKGNNILVFNINDGILESIIPTKGGEPEGVAISNGKLYLSYRHTGQQNADAIVFGISEFNFN